MYIKSESGGGRDDETRKKFGDGGWGMRDERKGEVNQCQGRESPIPILDGPRENTGPVPVRSKLEVTVITVITVILVPSRLLWYEQRAAHTGKTPNCYSSNSYPFSYPLSRCTSINCPLG